MCGVDDTNYLPRIHKKLPQLNYQETRQKGSQEHQNLFH